LILYHIKNLKYILKVFEIGKTKSYYHHILSYHIIMTSLSYIDIKLYQNLKNILKGFEIDK